MKEQERNVNFLVYNPSKTDQYYRTINLTSLLDKKLSFKAKGLHNYLITRPKKWKLFTVNLFTVSTDGETSVRSALKELIKLEYIHRFDERDERKRIIGWKYIVCSIPTKRENLNVENLNVENLNVENLDLGNRPHSNSIINNTIEKEVSEEYLYSSEERNNSISMKRIENSPEETKKVFSRQRPNSSVKNEYKSSAEKLIDYWSNLGFTINHSKNKESKTYKRILKKLIALQKGSFNKTGVFDFDWFEKRNISIDWFTRAWTYNELHDGLVQASKYAQEGYWTKNKDFYRSLDNIIFHIPYKKDQGICWLFEAIKNPPQTDRTTHTQFKNPHPGITKLIIKNPIWPKDYEFDESKLVYGIKELKAFVDNLFDPHNQLRFHLGNLQSIVERYLNWLEEQDWLTNINQNIISINHGLFKKFIEDQEDAFDMTIKSKGWKK